MVQIKIYRKQKQSIERQKKTIMFQVQWWKNQTTPQNHRKQSYSYSKSLDEFWNFRYDLQSEIQSMECYLAERSVRIDVFSEQIFLDELWSRTSLAIKNPLTRPTARRSSGNRSGHLEAFPERFTRIWMEEVMPHISNIWISHFLFPKMKENTNGNRCVSKKWDQEGVHYVFDVNIYE